MVNYMSYRKQTTVVNDHVSTTAPVTYGTAQGSTLGPLIFILYVNDLFEYIKYDSSIYICMLMTRYKSVSLITLTLLR